MFCQSVNHLLRFSILASLLIVRLLHARLSRHDFTITKRTNESFGTSITRKLSDIRGLMCTGVRKCWHLIIATPQAAIVRKTSALLCDLRAALRRESLGEEKNGPLNYIPIGSHANIIPTQPVALETCALRDSIATLASTNDLKRTILYLTHTSEHRNKKAKEKLDQTSSGVSLRITN